MMHDTYIYMPPCFKFLVVRHLINVTVSAKTDHALFKVFKLKLPGFTHTKPLSLFSRTGLSKLLNKI